MQKWHGFNSNFSAHKELKASKNDATSISTAYVLGLILATVLQLSPLWTITIEKHHHMFLYIK